MSLADGARGTSFSAGLLTKTWKPREVKLRPSSAPMPDGRRVGLSRAASAPTIRSKSSQCPVANPAYRSQTIELEVELREQLSAVSAAARWRSPHDSGRINCEKLKVYSDIFEALIQRNETYGPALRKVKEIYDACARPWMDPTHASDVARSTMTNNERCSTADGAQITNREVGEASLDAKLSELEHENRSLRAMAGRLHAERERVRRQKVALSNAMGAAEGNRCDLACASHKKPGIEDGLMGAELGLSAEDERWLFQGAVVAPTRPRPFSTMRVTASGVRTVW